MQVSDLKITPNMVTGAGESVLPAVVVENKNEPVGASSMPTSKKTHAEKSASVNKSKVASRVDKKARIHQQETGGKEVLVASKADSWCAPVSECNGKRVDKKPTQTQSQQKCMQDKVIPEKLASPCVPIQKTAASAEACLQADNVARDAVPVKKRKRCKRVDKSSADAAIFVEGSVSGHGNGPKTVKTAKAAVEGDNISSWLANVKQSFAKENTTHTIQRNDPIFAMFTKF